MKAPSKTINVRRPVGRSPTASDVKEIVKNAAERKAATAAATSGLKAKKSPRRFLKG